MSGIVSPSAGTRSEPMDSYVFLRGNTAIFKAIFLSDGRPVQVDPSTIPEAKILAPRFLSSGDQPVPEVLATLEGSLVTGQDFEYQFTWSIPITQTPIDEYIVSYQGYIGGIFMTFGDEFFTIVGSPGMVGLRQPLYATVDDVRQKKFNIDDYLPVALKSDLVGRNKLIESHLRDAASKLREEINLNQMRGMTENHRLFCIYYAVYTLMLGSRGEDGSSVSDQNLMFWRGEWENILAQEKRRGVAQGVPIGRG